MIIVIPCYKESLRLPHFLPGLVEALAGAGCKIQVVDDGSPAEDREKIDQHVEELRLKFGEILLPLLSLSVNQGKGKAIRAGWSLHQREAQLAFVDADGAIAPHEVGRFVRIAQANPEKAYFASRVKMLGRTVTRKVMRHLYGRVFATFVSVRLNAPVYDTQCGLKTIPGEIFRTHQERFQENGFAFDAELLLILLKLGVSVEEVPIDWTHIEGSKVRLIRDSFAMFTSLNAIVKRHSVWT